MRIDSFYLDREISNSTKWSTECPLLVHHSDRCTSPPVVRIHPSINHSYGEKRLEWLLWAFFVPRKPVDVGRLQLDSPDVAGFSGQPWPIRPLWLLPNPSLMEDLHPDHQILLLLSLTQLWWKKNSRLPPLQHRPLPLNKKPDLSSHQGSRVCASLMMRFTDQ